MITASCYLRTWFYW